MIISIVRVLSGSVNVGGKRELIIAAGHTPP